MALRDSEGFGLSATWADYINYNVFSYSFGRTYSSNAPSVAAGGAYGDNYVVMGVLCAPPMRTFPAALSTFFFGARVRLNGGGGNSGFIFADAADQCQFAVVFGYDGAISVKTMLTHNSNGQYVGGAVLGASDPLLIPVNGWQWVEVKGVIDAVAGAVTVRVNNTEVVALTGVNTAPYGATVRKIGAMRGSNDFHTQHWVLSDDTGAAPWNTFLGDVRVQTLFPTADDAVQFTHVGLGSNWLNAAKVPPVPFTDYNASSTVGEQDTFVMAPPSSDLGVIYGVHVKPLVYKSDAGARSGASVLKSDATTAVGATTVLSETAAQLKTMYQADPHTTAQWAPADAALIKVGYKVIA